MGSNADLKGLPVFFGKTGQVSFTRIPNFLVDNMMHRQRATNVPASFWKMTWVIWRHIMTPFGKDDSGGWKFDYTFKTTAAQMNEEHGIGPQAYMDWTLAYHLSGVFKVIYGKRHAKDVAGSPTVFKYRKNATFEDWAAFIAGLNQGLKEVRTKHIAHSGKLDGDFGEDRINAQNGFAMCLCFAIAEAREQAGLPSLHHEYIERAIKAGTATRTTDGITYTFVKRSLGGVNFKPKDYGSY